MKSIAALALVALVACTEGAPPAKTAASLKTPKAASTCPFGVDGARVLYEETPAGARLTFTASPEKLDDLRARARDAAAFHGPGGGLGRGHEGKHGDGGNHGLKAKQMPPAYAGAQDLEGGARIDLTPHDPDDLPELRAKVRLRAHELMTSCE